MRYALGINAGRDVGGSMSFREQLHAYIAQLEQRLRWSTILRGLAILTGSALVATLVLVTIANALAFSQGSVTAARFGLILILAVAAAAGLAIPMRRLTRRRLWGALKPLSHSFSSASLLSRNVMARIRSLNCWPGTLSMSPNPPSLSNWSPTAGLDFSRGQRRRSRGLCYG